MTATPFTRHQHLAQSCLLTPTPCSEPHCRRASLCPFQIRIDREGGWHYRGSPIARLPLVKLFATVLRRAEDGSYWLITPGEQGRIEVDDVPFTASSCRAREAPPAAAIPTNLEEWCRSTRASAASGRSR